MAIWREDPTVEGLNQRMVTCMVAHLGMKFTEIGDDYIKASMPVDKRTTQPVGILHGGASVALAETLGSVAANLVIDGEKYYGVGLDVNSNHIKQATSGKVIGVTRPIHIGRTTHVWEIKIYNEEEQLVNISRLTMAIILKEGVKH
ncbi:MAG: hotdog fold thioesterase [Bacteroidetes bacterium]|nr:hotdog fold thioesterase [Bacteroidota bacterium]